MFKKADNFSKQYEYYHYDKNKMPIYMILFDDLGLTGNRPSNSFQLLNTFLEDKNKNKNINLICISNYILDIADINTVLCLSLPNLEKELDQIRLTSKCIVRSISKEISEDVSNIFIFNILSRAYYFYKHYLNFIKKLMVLKEYAKDEKKFYGKTFREIEFEKGYKYLLKKEKKIRTEFHGNRDFYNLIKSVAMEGYKFNCICDEHQIVPIIANYIERNFGGINYEIDINFFKFEFDDIKDEIHKLKDILSEKMPYPGNKKNRGAKTLKTNDEDEIIKVSSIYLFKKIYNEACQNENNKYNNLMGNPYKIKCENIEKYDLNKCINGNINEYYSRYLLIGVNPNFSPLIINFINRMQKRNIVFINGSPFPNDWNNDEYKNLKI